MSRISKSAGVKLAAVATVFVSLLTLASCDGPTSRRAGSEARSLSTAGAASHDTSPAGVEAASQKLKGRFVYLETQATEVARRIIYEAQVNLVVKSISVAETEIGKLLKNADGYISESNVDRRQGENIAGRWKVRVPTAQFDSFLEEVSKIGIVESRTQTAQDVSEEFVDLEAQITNKKRLEERIVALLKESTGKIKDVIEVENELARVRGEIEQMEGRLRYLANRTDLTTVTIIARQEENYVPPEAPTFGSRVAHAWKSSLMELQSFGEEALVAAVAIFPWLIPLGVVLVPTAWYVKRRAAAVKQTDTAHNPDSNQVG
jgi:uncharacterized coiled-coil protein SlyX